MHEPQDKTTEARVVRVFLADDHPLVLHGLKSLIGQTSDIQVIGEAVSGTAALQRSVELRPDVLVLDLCMPGLSGLEVARRFLESCPECGVVVLTVLEDEIFVRRAIEAGVTGLVLKRSVVDQLFRAIRAVASHSVHIDAAFFSTDLAFDGEILFSSRRLALQMFIEHVAARSRRGD